MGTGDLKGFWARRPSWAAVRETVGFLGVVASLVFVGLQIRQNTSVARAQSRQDLASLNQEWLILLSTDSMFRQTFQKAWVDVSDTLTPDEVVRASWAMRLNMRRLENTYFQFVEGLIDESALNSYGFQAAPLFRSRKFQEWWKPEKNAFDPGFVQMFEERFHISGDQEG